MYSNIPNEMKQYRQWVVWKYHTLADGKKTKVPYSVNGFQASVVNPNHWTTFDEAIKATNFDGIGFVLTENDPFCFIDLDHSEDPETIRQQKLIFENFNDTYAEFSPSGKGLHIICKGSLPQGRKRNKVEMYSAQRFMTMTGAVYNRLGIVNCQPKLNTLFNALNTKKHSDVEIQDEAERYTDEEIINTAYSAENGEKFADLYKGDWHNHYSSQSEADHALINIIAFYSRNSEQIKRIFLSSELGKREKAKRADYVGNMIKRSFDNYIPPIDTSALAESIRKEVELKQTQNFNRGIELNLKLLTIPQLFPKELAKIELNQPLPDLKTVNFQYEENCMNTDFEMLPDGLIKEIARFVYAQSPRPVKEIAMITALAFMSGICGRSYNISGTGLNNYFVLLAPTGIGKEGISKGIDKLINSILPQQPMADKFIGVGELVSGISLLRYLSEESNCCLSIQGEFGLTMQRMNGRLATTPMIQLRKILLELYGKSGKGSLMRGSVYADTARNIKEINAPSFTLLGESTPETFYDSLSDSLVDEGLMSRFNIIECNAKRPPLNKYHHMVEVPEVLKQTVLQLASNCLTLNATNGVIDIETTPDAQQMLDDFDIFCDNKINNSTNESYRQLWNRGHLKSLKIASLFAIGDNLFKPIINKEHVQYAISFVQESINTIYKKYSTSEIGAISTSDNKQIIDACAVIKNNLLNPTRMKVNDLMLKDYIMPFRDILQRINSYRSYKIEKSKSEALRKNLIVLETFGVISEIRGHIAKEKYNFNGKCYAVTNAKFFLNDEYQSQIGD